MRAYTPHPVTHRDQRLQRETIPIPPPPITAELYNFLYSLINKTPARAFTPPADEKKMGTIWIFVPGRLYRGR